MAYPIDSKTIRTIILQMVEHWSGGPLSDEEQGILDHFMENEVKPLSNIEILDRMGTPADTINWFVSYMHSRITRKLCGERYPEEACMYGHAC